MKAKALKTSFILTSIFFLSSYVFANVSKYKVVIRKEVLNNALDARLLLTDKAGIIVFDKTYLPQDFFDHLTIEYRSLNDEEINLTVILNYEFKYRGSSIPNPCIISRLNIDEYSEIRRDDFIDKFQLPSQEERKLRISGIGKVDGVNVFSKSTEASQYHTKIGNHLNVYFDHDNYTDLFAYIREKNNDSVKYAYIPAENIKNNMEYEYSNLFEDLELVTFPFPVEKNSLYNIGVKNMITGNPCGSVHVYPEDEDVENYSILAPTEEFIFSYHITYYGFFMRLDYGNRYSYLESDGLDIPDYEDLDTSKYQYKIWSFDQNGLEIATLNPSNEVTIYLHTGHQSIGNGRMEEEYNWIISGKPKGNFVFNFPLVDPDSKNSLDLLFNNNQSKLKMVTVYQTDQQKVKTGMADFFYNFRMMEN